MCGKEKRLFPFKRETLLGFWIPWKKAEAKEPGSELGALRPAQTPPREFKEKKKKTEETFQGEPLHAVKNTQVL